MSLSLGESNEQENSLEIQTKTLLVKLASRLEIPLTSEVQLLFGYLEQHCQSNKQFSQIDLESVFD